MIEGKGRIHSFVNAIQYFFLGIALQRCIQGVLYTRCLDDSRAKARPSPEHERFFLFVEGEPLYFSYFYPVLICTE